MSLQTFIRVTLFTSLFSLLSTSVFADWSVDFSRRSKSMSHSGWGAAEAPQNQKSGLFDKIFDASVPVHEIVILNTDHGFVPASIRVREGHQYKVHVVNVNDKAKNVSFVLDAFSEHHATYYGKIKTFNIHPKREGVYTFNSPETSAQGRLVVYPPFKKKSSSPEIRLPASEE